MHETATLHFDLSHLATDQPFMLHAGPVRYDLTPHTRRTLARSRRENDALSLIPDDRITHFAGPVRLPGNCPMLLRVTAPKRDPAEPLDRLVLVSLTCRVGTASPRWPGSGSAGRASRCQCRRSSPPGGLIASHLAWIRTRSSSTCTT